MKKILPLFFVAITAIYSQNFVYDNDKILMEKTTPKIKEMSQEVYEKTGIQVILNIVKKLPEGATITSYEKEFVQKIVDPYIVVSFSALDMKVNLITSSDIDFIDKDEILDDYIIPILISKNKKVSVQQIYSAALLNGMAEISDQVAENKKIVLDSSIGSESKNFIAGLSYVIKTMIILTILAFGYAWYNRKK